MAGFPVANAKNLSVRFSNTSHGGMHNITPELARAVDKARRGATTHRGIDAALELANKAVNGFGVEAIRGAWHDHYYQDIVALYVNTGDTYSPSVVYDTVADKFYAVDWGTFVEYMTEEYGIV